MNWKGGKEIIKERVYIKNHTHPRRLSSNYVQESLLIVEKAMGKPLPPKALIHHADGNPANNLNKNLVVCQDQDYHMLIEQRTRAYFACGNPHWRICTFCKQYDDPQNMYIRGSNQAWHRECRRQKEKSK